METRSEVFWAGNISLLVLSILLSACAGGKELRVMGRSAMDDGKAIPSATIVLVELQGPFFLAPRQEYEAQTDQDGFFSILVHDIKGVMDIRLIDEPCVRSGAETQVNSADFLDGEVVEVELISAYRSCPGSS
jgi:hypothetical protein